MEKSELQHLKHSKTHWNCHHHYHLPVKLIIMLTFDTGAACVVEDVAPDELLFYKQKVNKKTKQSFEQNKTEIKKKGHEEK